MCILLFVNVNKYNNECFHNLSQNFVDYLLQLILVIQWGRGDGGTPRLWRAATGRRRAWEAENRRIPAKIFQIMEKYLRVWKLCKWRGRVVTLAVCGDHSYFSVRTWYSGHGFSFVMCRSSPETHGKVVNGISR